MFLEQSAWDLKLVFGQLDQTGGTAVVNQHTAITLPWSQAKIFSYLLEAHLLAFEMANGKIMVPSNTIPPELPPPTDDIKANPNAQQIYDALKKLREEFITGL